MKTSLQPGEKGGVAIRNDSALSSGWLNSMRNCRRAELAATLSWLLFSTLGRSAAFSQVTLQNVPMDVLKAVQAGAASLTGSPLDIGTLSNVFDGNTNTLARTPNVNPAFVQVAYTNARTLTRFRVMPSYGTSYDWWLEKADTQADMDSHSGSWAVVTKTNNVLSWSWGEQAIPPTTAGIWRLDVRRYGGDGYCHINEWQLFGEVTLDSLQVTPSSVSMLYSDVQQFHATGYSVGQNETFNLDLQVQWVLSGDIGTLSDMGLFTAGKAGQGSITAAIGALVSSPATVMVQQSDPDIDVLYIERTPRLAFDPGNTAYTSGLPVPGQSVTYLAHVKNWGSASANVPFEWWFDDVMRTNGSVWILGGTEVTVPFPWSWETNDHTLEFRVDPQNQLYELSKLNNRVRIRSNALLIGLWVEQGLYNYFHQGQKALHDGANSFEDWGQRMVNRWNYLFAKARFPVSPEGFLDRVALDKVVVVPDGALPLAGGLAGNNPDSRDRTVDMQWGYSWDPASTNTGGFYSFRWNGPFFIDFGSIHEMNHARYHIDLYALDENHNSTTPNVPLIDDDTGLPVVGSSKMPFIAWDVVYYNKWRDIMGAGPTVFDAYSAGAWNWKHHRRGQGNQNSPPDLGRFLNDLPLTNHVQFIDQTGQPLAGADVWLYRTSGGFYSKVFNPSPAATYVADGNGFIHLGRNPFGVLPDFSYSSPIIIFKVRYRGQYYYLFQEVTDFNMQNWLNAGPQRQGNEGFYVREIDLRDALTSVPNNAWLGNYFTGGNFESFVTNRIEGNAAGLNFDWVGAPADNVPADNFSVYWQGGIIFPEGWKQFQISADGGFRLLIDGRLVFDQWTNQSLKTWAPIIFTSASAPFVNPGRSTAHGSYHRVEVRYRHTQPSAAHVQLSWADEQPPTEVPVNAWRADYYSTKSLAGYLLSRLETEISNDYGNGSPDPAVGADNFSARWMGDFDFPGGNVTFTAVPDDGMRVYIDGSLALDKWFDQPPTTYSFTRALPRGRHRVRVEYYEGTVTAQAVFTWRLPPWFLEAPTNQIVLEGSDINFAAKAGGLPTPAYQWMLNKEPLAGAITASLTLTNVQLTNSGMYMLVLSNTTGVASAGAKLTVVPRNALPVVSAPMLLPNGQFQLFLSGSTGWTYLVQTSTNLLDWEPLAQLPYTNGPAKVLDAGAATNVSRFYRAEVLSP